MAKSLFEETSIGLLKLENRVFRSSVWNGYGVKRYCSIEDTECYDEIAKGEQGCIITGFSFVSDYGVIEKNKNDGNEWWCIYWLL